MEAGIAAAVEIGRTVGLEVRDPVVLSDGPTTVVHLAPEPVVARVVPAAGAPTRDALEREVGIAAHLGRAGGEVVAPLRLVDPGPYARDGVLVTLWEHVDHDSARPLDGVRAGRALRRIHELLRDVDAAALPHFTRADETRALVGRLHLQPRQRHELEAVLEAARAAAAGIDADLQPVHGDAHLGNVLRSSSGPVWGDLDRVCLGPRELDLACNEIRVLHRGRQQPDDDLLAGYGEHDRALVALLVPVHLAGLAARTFELAARRPEFVPLAEQRLRWAADGLGL